MKKMSRSEKCVWATLLAGALAFLVVAAAGCGTLDRAAYRQEVTWTNAPVVTVVNGLTLNGTASLSNHNTRLDFSGTQTLSGNGTVVFNNLSYYYSANALRVTSDLPWSGGVTIEVATEAPRGAGAAGARQAPPTATWRWSCRP